MSETIRNLHRDQADLIAIVEAYQAMESSASIDAVDITFYLECHHERLVEIEAELASLQLFGGARPIHGTSYFEGHMQLP